MNRTWKQKIAKATGSYRNLDKRALRMKSSWDEVEKLLNMSVKKKSKGK